MERLHFPYTPTYEIGGDGELYGIATVDADGHLDYLDAELFLATAVAEELDDGEDYVHPFGIEIEHLWRSEHPLDPEEYDDEDGLSKRWTYSYSDTEIVGSVPVTRFRVADPWSRPALTPRGPRATPKTRGSNDWIEEGVDDFPVMCINHDDEPATVGVPKEQFVNDAEDDALEGYVHYCSPCSDAFRVRLAEARREALAKLDAEREAADAV